jgi:hypothetical protein
VRRLRWFQPHEYVSVDYARQEATVTGVDFAGGKPALSYRKLATAHEEPLRLQLADFLTNVRERNVPRMGGKEGQRALLLAHQILEEIAHHLDRLKSSGGVEPFLPPSPEAPAHGVLQASPRPGSFH